MHFERGRVTSSTARRGRGYETSPDDDAHETVQTSGLRTTLQLIRGRHGRQRHGEVLAGAPKMLSASHRHPRPSDGRPLLSTRPTRLALSRGRTRRRRARDAVVSSPSSQATKHELSHQGGLRADGLPACSSGSRRAKHHTHTMTNLVYRHRTYTSTQHHDTLYFYSPPGWLCDQVFGFFPTQKTSGAGSETAGSRVNGGGHQHQRKRGVGHGRKQHEKRNRNERRIMAPPPPCDQGRGRNGGQAGRAAFYKEDHSHSRNDTWSASSLMFFIVIPRAAGVGEGTIRVGGPTHTSTEGRKHTPKEHTERETWGVQGLRKPLVVSTPPELHIEKRIIVITSIVSAVSLLFPVPPRSAERTQIARSKPKGPSASPGGGVEPTARAEGEEQGRGGASSKTNPRSPPSPKSKKKTGPTDPSVRVDPITCCDCPQEPPRQ